MSAICSNSRKQVLLEKYAAQYPAASSIAWVYEQLLPIYKDAKDYQKVIALGNALLAVDPKDLDAVYDVLRAAEATEATELVRIFSQRAWDIASKAVQTPKPSDPDDVATCFLSFCAHGPRIWFLRTNCL